MQLGLKFLDGLRNAIGLARVHSFASLLDLFENGGVVEGSFGGNICGLSVEGNVIFLDACDELID